MHKRGLCRHAVSVRLSVCVFVRLSRSWIMSKRINISSKFFHTILVFPYQTGWRYSDGTPLTEASNAGGVGKKRDSGGPISGFIGHLYSGAYSISIAKRWLEYFLIISVSICTKVARSILMRDRNTGTQPNFKNRFLDLEFCRRKTVVLTFLRRVSSKFAAMSKINKWRHGHLSYGDVIRWAAVTWYAY